MRSKTFMSKINLQRGKLTVENRKSTEKTDMLRSIGKQSGEYAACCTHADVKSRISTVIFIILW